MRSRRSPFRPLALSVLLPLVWQSVPVYANECAAGSAELPRHAMIAAEGDSLTYGLDTTASGGQAPINGSRQQRSIGPFPETLGKLLAGRATVVNRGFPGDRSVDGLERWRDAPMSDATLLMYGTNDFGNFGHAPDGPLSVADFAGNLAALIERRETSGHVVIVMSPPPLSDVAADLRLEPYRDAARSVAAAKGARYIDTVAVLQAVDGKWIDGLHLSPGANRALAGAVAMEFCLPPG